jgi:hypothetical protein
MSGPRLGNCNDRQFALADGGRQFATPISWQGTESISEPM